MCIRRTFSSGWRHERSECHRHRFLMKRSFLREVDCLRGVGAIHRAGACGVPLKRDIRESNFI